MKRSAAIAGILFFAAFGLAAAVWDGSAVAGGAGDFPDDGLYGACNSFPRDTSVTVTNLENGKTVTVTITRNVDNPGVFIALSPKAAAELGMHAGSATRIRAVALIASQADTSLPPTRAGETSDPDYNPKIYVEREKAAVAAAAAAPSAALAEATPPAAAVRPSAPTSPAAAPTSAQPSAAVAQAAAPESAEVLARIGEPKKEPTPVLPSLTEPKPTVAAKAAAAPAATTPPAPATKPGAGPAVAAKPASTKPPADVPALPEASPTFPGSPRPSPLGMSLPPPDLPSIPAGTPPVAHGGYIAQAPEVLGGAKPHPRKSVQPRLVIADPALPSAIAPAATAPAAAAKAPEKASVDALSRPPLSLAASKLTLAEPKPEFAPEELPDAVLSRVVAPSQLNPTPLLAEAREPASAIATKEGLEALAREKPSYAAAVEAAALAEASPLSPADLYSADRPGQVHGKLSAAELAEAGLPGIPEALYVARPARAAATAVELAEADLLAPPEALYIASAAKASEALAELQVPDIPRPSESLTAGSPNAVAPGQAVAELAEPNPNREKAAVEVPAGPETATAVAVEKPALTGPSGSVALGSPAVPNPTESIAAEHPALAAVGERTVTLEPAAPRPPAATTGTAPAEPTHEPPAAVATIKGPTPAGAAQAPASIPMIKGLAKGSFYVQIGVYSTNDAMSTAVAGFKSSSYPLAVEKLTTKTGSAAYRLFVGPLSRDESGTVLIRIRSLGF
jgi:hypothetical protein